MYGEANVFNLTFFSYFPFSVFSVSPYNDNNNKNLSHFTQHALPRHKFSSKA